MATPQLSIVPSASTKRIPRKPSQSFAVSQKPMVLTPIFAHPVLAGETLKNMQWQSRAISMPVKAPLTGWWLEYYAFYVKLRDLDEREDIENMLLDINANNAALKTGVDSAHWMETVGQIPWVRMATKRVVEEYFRDEDETWNSQIDASVDGLPVVKHGQKNFFESMFRQSEVPAESIPATGGVVDAGDFDVLYHKWLFARAQKITEMDFEDYLKSFGVNSSRVERDKPELIRYVKEWTYPSNTIDPASGAPSSAVSWSIAERADKDRYFTEPGFVIMYSVARPKIHIDLGFNKAMNFLDNAMAWLPALMNSAPQTSLVEFAAGAGPLATLQPSTGGHAYMYDIRDMFTYGDVGHVNLATAVTSYGPKNGLNTGPTHWGSQYYKHSDLTGLFVDPAKPFIVQDGIVSLNILGAQVDYT